MTQEDIILKFRIDELEECLDLIEDEISDKINHGHYKQEESYMNLVLNCTGKSLLTLRELILLCKNGFPDGALGLARNLFEQFIIISVFEAQCEGVDRDRMVEKYYADYNVQRYNAGLRERACEIAETIFCKQIKRLLVVRSLLFYRYVRICHRTYRWKLQNDGYKFILRI